MDSSLKKQILASLNNPITFDPIAKQSFDAADKNKNGTIDKQELYQCMKDVADGLGAPLPKREEVENMFKTLDIDRSGTLDFNEFKSFVKDNMIKIIKNM